MNVARLAELVGRFPKLKIGVLGDFFLDQYLVVDPKLAEPSVETGKTAHQVIGTRCSAGAAGTVVNNLSALGVGRLVALGAVGDDGPAYELRRALKMVGCDTQGLIGSDQLMTPVYMKPVDCGDLGLDAEHSRYDIRNRRPTPHALIKRVLATADEILPQLDALIVVDQVEDELCETVTPAVRQWVAERALEHQQIVFWADSRFHISEFQGVWIKPNQFEAVGHVPCGPDEQVDSEAVSAALPQLRDRNQAPVTVTLGERGLLISDPSPKHLPAFPVEGPLDTTGAGDSLTAGMVASLCAGATQEEAGWIGNVVASLTIEQLGTTGTARPEQVYERLEIWKGQAPALFK